MDIRRRLFQAIGIVTAVTIFAVIGYRTLGGPGVSLLDALYMAVITLAGIGYGEIVPTEHNPVLRIFNIFVVIFGFALMGYVVATVTAFMVEGELTDIFRRRKMQKRISELRHHYIVCGLGDTGRYVVDELQKTGTPYVVVDTNEEHLEKFREHRGSAFKEMLYVIGDATDEETLDHAALKSAKGLIAAVASDKDNLVITVMVRQKSPKIRIVTRCTDVKYSDRMLKAGANSTVSPNQIGGMRLASEVLRPHVVGFLDLMLKEQSRTLRIEEVEVGTSSPWVGSTLGQLDIRRHYNLGVLAIKKARATALAEFVANPPDESPVEAGTVLIVMGDVSDVRRARHDAAHEGTEVVAAGSAT